MIGDYVLVNGTPRKVEMITKKKIGYHINPQDNRLYYARLRDVKPITIDFIVTKGLLGFEYIISTNSYVSWVLGMDLRKRDGCYWTGIHHPACFEISILYFHELQHLYFLLTQKRLDVK